MLESQEKEIPTPKEALPWFQEAFPVRKVWAGMQGGVGNAAAGLNKRCSYEGPSVPSVGAEICPELLGRLEKGILMPWEGLLFSFQVGLHGADGM